MNISLYRSKLYYQKLTKILDSYKNKELVFFCVGNYKIWFDSFAPIVSKLLKSNSNNCFIYGGIDFSITPENLQEYMDFVERKHPCACIIVLDNCLTTDVQQNGQLIITNRSTTPAGLINTKYFGHVSVLLKTYIKQDCFKFLQLQNIVVNELVCVLNNIIKSR